MSNKLTAYNRQRFKILELYSSKISNINCKIKSEEADAHNKINMEFIAELTMYCSSQFAFIEAQKLRGEYEEFLTELRLEVECG
jgi:hypothetical protein